MTSTTSATKTRFQSPAVARRKMLRSVMKRANYIAKNAHNVHNSSIERVAKYGASTSPSEFLSMSISIAWKEQKTGAEIYKVVGKIPRKSIQTIHAALNAKMAELKADKLNTQNPAEYNFVLAKTLIFSRNAGKFEQADVDLAKLFSYELVNPAYAVA